MKFWKTILIIVGTVRFLIAGVLFINPFLAELGALLFDWFDSGVAYLAGISWKAYTRYDKLLDYWWYIFILIYSIGKPIFAVVLMLFAIRSVGQILTIVTSKHEYLFWFPNVLEHYFILYLLVTYFAPQYLIYFSGPGVVIPLTIAFITKMPQEYILHRRGWFYSSNKWPKSITDLLISLHN